MCLKSQPTPKPNAASIPDATINRLTTLRKLFQNEHHRGLSCVFFCRACVSCSIESKIVFEPNPEGVVSTAQKHADKKKNIIPPPSRSRCVCSCFSDGPKRQRSEQDTKQPAYTWSVRSAFFSPLFFLPHHTLVSKRSFSRAICLCSAATLASLSRLASISCSRPVP